MVNGAELSIFTVCTWEVAVRMVRHNAARVVKQRRKVVIVLMVLVVVIVVVVVNVVKLSCCQVVG
jgi:hypothetical protein